VLHVTALIPLLPLAGFGLLCLLGRRLGNPWAGWLATAAVTASFALTLVVFAGLLGRPAGARSFTQSVFSWVPVGGLQVKVSFLADPLSVTMALFVTGVSAVIHLYSIGYMGHDEQFPKFFVYMNLFVSSMLVLVLADNFLFSFLGWEGVGLCSYLLIAFWFERESAATAGLKAFVFNRVGDVGFLVAMFFLFASTGTLSYRGVFAASGHLAPSTVTAVVLLLFLAATGKSAQIPLFTWLPDAMEGPTPVSALIHAATMVTAGVYLMTRVSPLLAHSSSAALVIAVIGAATAFVAATIACAQDDIKRVLAYSTVSQLGYMFLAVGCGAYVAAIFLMVAHAFFKALLFLSAGSVIHGLDDEQDLKRMGGLRRYMPVTYGAFLVGWLAIAGVPPLAGFWAKSDILLNAYAKDPGLWVVAAATSVLTAYYMGREFFLAFYGPERWGGLRGAHPPHDPGWTMSAPVVLLAVLSVFGGFLDLPFHPHWVFLERWLDPVVGANLYNPRVGLGGLWALAVVDGVLALAGVYVAGWVWGRVWDRPALEPAFLRQGWYADLAIDDVVGRPSRRLADFASAVVELKVIDGAVNGVAEAVRAAAGSLRRVQTGYVRNYALLITGGAVAVLAFVLARAGG